MLIPIYAFLPYQRQKEFILCRLVGNFWTPLSFIPDEPLYKKTKADTFYTTSGLPYPVIETPYTRRYNEDGIVKVPFNKSEYEKGVESFIKELYVNASPSSTFQEVAGEGSVPDQTPQKRLRVCPLPPPH